MIIKADGVSFSYSEKGRKILSSLSLSVEKGEFVTILGPNGSGKSTLGKLLSGLLKPTEGTIEIAGLASSSPLLRTKVGIVFQNPDNQIVGDTVEEDTAFGPENLGLGQSEIERRVERALSMVGALELKDRSPRLLSGGQKQRVAIAGVLALEPEVLVLDESTSMLDPEGRREVLESILRLQREEGLTVLLITHHAEECLLSDRTLVVADGHIVAEGKPREILTDHRLLGDLGLEIPFGVRLSLEIRRRGIGDFPLLLTLDEIVEETGRRLC